MPNAILFDILAQVKAAIVARGLAGIGTANVVVQKVPGNRAADLPAQQFPCIVIAPDGSEQLDPLAGSLDQSVVGAGSHPGPTRAAHGCADRGSVMRSAVEH